ncbi:MAG: hypothetical protein HY918_04830 [Candidatus Doudnabacteria bacterium]|nr:hypothetical protein [Candidatus Doudnabacteria bacterium]
MNPYAYQKTPMRPSVSAQEGESLTGLAKKFLSALAGAKISAVTAVAFILFAAVSVGAITLVSYSEIAGENGLVNAVQPVKSKVLGVATYGYNQPICQKNTANCLNYQLIGYSGAGWQVQINYQLQNNLKGAIKVNTWNFMDNIVGSGNGRTGYDLIPGKTYTFVLYAKSGSSLYKLTSLSITAPQAPTDPVACAQDAYLCPDGSYVGRTAPSCNFICPAVPAYGYTTANVGPVNQGEWREGWIERFSATNYATEPSDVTIEGWAYDSGKNIDLKIVLKDAVTGREYQGQMVAQSPLRSDIVSYLNKITGSNKSSTSGMFRMLFSNVPAGKYYLANARYNGYLFNIHSQANQPLYISAKPSYGYKGGLNIYSWDTTKQVETSAGKTGVELFSFEVSNSAGTGPYALSSLTFSSASADALKSLGNYWVTDEYGNIIGKKDTVVSPSVTYGYNVIFTSPLVISVNAVRYLKFKADILSTAPNTTFQLQALGIGYWYPNTYGYSYPGQVNGLNNPISKTIIITSSAGQTGSPRVGQLINKSGTVFLVGNGVIYGIPSLAVFNSWGWNLGNIVNSNSSEDALPQGGVVPFRDPNCSTALDQILGKCPVSAKPIDVAISLNNAVASPIIVIPGQTNQKIASFVISSGTSGEVNVSYIGFFAQAGIEKFQNLKMMVGSTQVGATVAAPIAGQNYYFSPSASGLKIPAGGQIIVDAYADATTSANVNNAILIAINKISGTLTASGRALPDGLGLTGQLIITDSAAADSGFSIKASSLAYSLTVTPGLGKQKIGSFDLTASVAGDVAINTITVYMTRNVIGDSFSGLYLRDGLTGYPLGSVQSYVTSNGIYTFTPGSPLVIAAGSKKVIEIYADIAASASSLNISGQNLLGILKVAAYKYNTGVAINIPSPVAGQLIYFSNTSVNHAPSAPSIPFGLGTALQPGVSQKIQFVANDADQDQLTYNIVWGDGSATTTQTGLAGTTLETSHVWASAGTYIVRIFASDGKGGSSSNYYIATVIATVPTPTVALSASFVSQSVPSTVAAGSYLDAVIIFKNTSTQTWTNSLSNYQFQIGSQNPTGNKTWEGNALTLYKDILPGETVTFAFHVKVPTVAGTYNFQWQMLQNTSAGAKYFGDLTPNVQIVVK